jgi:hypothetical protein
MRGVMPYHAIGGAFFRGKGREKRSVSPQIDPLVGKHDHCCSAKQYIRMAFLIY